MAKDAGLELGVRGTIKVNEDLQTSDPSIYAVGDAIEVKDYITERLILSRLQVLLIVKVVLWQMILMVRQQSTKGFLELQS